jgi:hypothetical protein
VSVGIEFEDIRIGDYIQSFGLGACESGDETFYAFIIITSFKAHYEDYSLPSTVEDNNISRYLPAGVYEQSLVVNGNSFRLTGESGPEGCLSAVGWSVIGGKVSISGNNAVFKNIWFDSDVKINGNNTDFIDCCFAQQ